MIINAFKASELAAEYYLKNIIDPATCIASPIEIQEKENKVFKEIFGLIKERAKMGRRGIKIYSDIKFDDFPVDYEKIQEQATYKEVNFYYIKKYIERFGYDVFTHSQQKDGKTCAILIIRWHSMEFGGLIKKVAAGDRFISENAKAMRQPLEEYYKSALQWNL
jgi:hypothetical protein